MKVQNRTCVRRLSLRALAASRTRNLVAVLAIALTALLFTSLFTIALSINEGFQQATFRQVGGYAHGGFKYITEEQAQQFRQMEQRVHPHPAQGPQAAQGQHGRQAEHKCRKEHGTESAAQCF